MDAIFWVLNFKKFWMLQVHSLLWEHFSPICLNHCPYIWLAKPVGMVSMFKHWNHLHFSHFIWRWFPCNERGLTCFCCFALMKPCADVSFSMLVLTSLNLFALMKRFVRGIMIDAFFHDTRLLGSPWLRWAELILCQFYLPGGCNYCRVPPGESCCRLLCGFSHHLPKIEEWEKGIRFVLLLYYKPKAAHH